MSANDTALEAKHAFLKSAEALEQFLICWKRGTLPKSAWTHAAHVAVGAYYNFDHTRDVAFQMIKAGIIHFNTCVGTANTEDSGYHETLTRFWSQIIGDFVRRTQFSSRFAAVRGAVKVFGDSRDHFKRYSSFDVVRDRHARREWVEPDREPRAEHAQIGDECVAETTACEADHDFS